MTSLSRVVLILGAGANVGGATAQLFAKHGYKVATVSRTAKKDGSSDAPLSIAADFTNPRSIPAVFAQVKGELGMPNVVIYNAAAHSRPPINDPLSVELDTFEQHLAVNTTSAFVAAQEAVLGFKAIDNDAVPCTFIYTGNLLNTRVVTPLLTLGVGKSATAHLIELASGAYGEKYSFYYADERTAEGGAMYGDIGGDAHAKFFLQLAQKEVRVPWHATFVKGKGYVKFTD